MADVDYRTLLYTKAEIDAFEAAETLRVDTAIALKLDESEVGGDNGIPRLSGGVIVDTDIDWADNADALAGTSAVKVMSPLRMKEAHDYFLTNVGGVTQVSTTVNQLNTFNIAPAKIDFFDTNCVTAGSHFTVDAINQQITINTTGIYRITGMMSIEAVLAAELTMAPYKNGISVFPDKPITGLGAGNPVGWDYNLMCTLTAGDVVTIWGGADADATATTIVSSAFGMEKIIHG